MTRRDVLRAALVAPLLPLAGVPTAPVHPLSRGLVAAWVPGRYEVVAYAYWSRALTDAEIQAFCELTRATYSAIRPFRPVPG